MLETEPPKAVHQIVCRKVAETMNEARLWNLIFGFVGFVLIAYPLFALNLYLIDPGVLPAVVNLIFIAAGIYVIEGALISAVIWVYINPKKAPEFAVSIRNRLSTRGWHEPSDSTTNGKTLLPPETAPLDDKISPPTPESHRIDR